MTPSFVAGRVTVLLLFVTPVITFQLQNTGEPQWETVNICDHFLRLVNTTTLGNTHRAEDELVNHSGYEESPVDVQQLKNHQHHIEEVISKEGRIVVQRVHPGTVDQPTRDTRMFVYQTNQVPQIWPRSALTRKGR